MWRPSLGWGKIGRYYFFSFQLVGGRLEVQQDIFSTSETPGHASDIKQVASKFRIGGEVRIKYMQRYPRSNMARL